MAATSNPLGPLGYFDYHHRRTLEVAALVYTLFYARELVLYGVRHVARITIHAARLSAEGC